MLLGIEAMKLDQPFNDKLFNLFLGRIVYFDFLNRAIPLDDKNILLSIFQQVGNNHAMLIKIQRSNRLLQEQSGICFKLQTCEGLSKF